MAPAAFQIEPLVAAHDRNDFACGVPALDRYLREMATQDIRRRVSGCFIAVNESGVIAGYYTFAAASLPLTELPPEEVRRLPRYGVLPAGLIGRLAVDQRFRGQRLGGALVVDAACRAASADPATFALVVDAKNAAAVSFYQHLDFRPFQSRLTSLYLPITTALKAFGIASDNT